MNSSCNPRFLILMVMTGVFLINFAFGIDVKPKWDNMLVERCVHENITYFYMRLSNATECDGMVKWHDTHNWKFVAENDGEVILTFENNMTAKEKAFEEGKVENR